MEEQQEQVGRLLKGRVKEEEEEEEEGWWLETLRNITTTLLPEMIESMRSENVL